MISKVLRGFLAVWLGFSMLGVSGYVSAGEREPQMLWKQKVGFQPSDVQAGDLNRDAKADVVVGYTNFQDTPQPSIVAFDSHRKVLWRFETNNSVPSLAIGDIDGDGSNDVAAYIAGGGTAAFLYAISSDGVELWNRTLLPAPGGAPVKIGDVDGIGGNEIIVGASFPPFEPSTLVAFDSLGNPILNYSTPSGTGFIELADLTGDLVEEVVFSYGYRCPPCGIQAIKGDGTLLWDLPHPVRLGDGVVGDITNDSKPDVVVVELTHEGNKVHAIDNLGFLLWTFQLQGGATSVALGDLSGNGIPEVVVGSTDHHVYVIDGSGQLMWSFDTGASVVKVDVGDLDGDDQNEVAAANVAAWDQYSGGSNEVLDPAGVYGIDSDGSFMWFFPKEKGRVLEGPGFIVKGFWDLVVADIDGDEIDEVVGIAQDEHVYALKTHRPSPPLRRR